MKFDELKEKYGIKATYFALLIFIIILLLCFLMGYLIGKG
jgi:hypothetical protein